MFSWMHIHLREQGKRELTELRWKRQRGWSQICVWAWLFLLSSCFQVLWKSGKGVSVQFLCLIQLLPGVCRWVHTLRESTQHIWHNVSQMLALWNICIVFLLNYNNTKEERSLCRLLSLVPVVSGIFSRCFQVFCWILTTNSKWGSALTVFVSRGVRCLF